MERFETRFSVTPQLFGSVARALLWRLQGGYIIASMVLAVVAIWRLRVEEEVAFWSFWLGVSLTFWYLWMMSVWRAKRSVRLLGPIEIELVVDELGCTFRGPNSLLWFAWSEVRTVHVLEVGLMIDRRSGINPIPIPAEALPAPKLDDMVAYARENRAVIRYS